MSSPKDPDEISRRFNEAFCCNDEELAQLENLISQYDDDPNPYHGDCSEE